MGITRSKSFRIQIRSSQVKVKLESTQLQKQYLSPNSFPGKHILKFLESLTRLHVGSLLGRGWGGDLMSTLPADHQQSQLGGSPAFQSLGGETQLYHVEIHGVITLTGTGAQQRLSKPLGWRFPEKTRGTPRHHPF